MSTRSNICMLNRETKTIKKIYCHLDGYPEGVGRMLHENYRTKERVNELINLGNISFLEENLIPDSNIPHSFDNPQLNVTVAYSRDRDESYEENAPQELTYDKFAKFLKQPDWIEYVYLFIDDQTGWIFWHTGYTRGECKKTMKENIFNLETYFKENKNGLF